jgi:hypothetical protein
MIELLLCVLVTTAAVVFAALWLSRQFPSTRARAMPMHTLLAQQLANPPAEDSAGAEQAVSDALACYDAATRQAMTASNYAEWAVVRLLCRHGLGFLVPFSGQALPPGDHAVLLVGTPRADSPQPAVPMPSAQATDQSPYYHPGGFIDGHRVLPGWYPTPWWSEVLRLGPYTLGNTSLPTIAAGAAARAAVSGGGGISGAILPP